MRALHVQIQALSAAYPYPFLKSGTLLTLPAPPFSNILGNISACAGRPVGPAETAIAFEFVSNGTQAMDLERTRRLRVEKTGRLRSNPEQGLAIRQFHVKPKLDLYLTEVRFKECFESPAAAPCLGRSQDLGWIKFVREIDLHPIPAGRLTNTLVPFPNRQTGGRILPPLADYFENETLGYVRTIGRLSRYLYVQSARVKAEDDFAIFHPSDSGDPEHAIYLHTFGI